MLPIFLTSVTPFAGKNVVALGLAQKLRREKKSVGFFKPFGPLPTCINGVVVDEDAAFFKKVLDLPESLETLCPVVLTDQTISEAMRGASGNARDRILSAYKTASQGKDIVLSVSLARLSSGLTFGYSMDKFAQDIAARVIIVANYRWPTETLDGILHMKKVLGDQVAGVVFNRISPSRTNQIDQEVRAFLRGHGMDVLCVASDDPILNAVPISDMVEALGGKVLCAQDKLDQLAENISIGAMTADVALRFFQRTPHKVVITGGDRADIQLTALQTSTRCLILTGDLYPNERILTRAEELGVPVILVSQDTFTTAETCDRLRWHMSLNSEHKIARAVEIVDRCMDWKRLQENLGMD